MGQLCMNSINSIRLSSRVATAAILFSALTVILVGCDIDLESEPLFESEVIGVYQPTYETGGTERIVLRADSTYFHTYDLPDGRHFSDSGRWNFLYELGVKSRPRITFDKFVDWYPLSDGCYSDRSEAQLSFEPKGWMPYIKKLKDGTIRIERCTNYNQHYSKVR
jgi:hypothetical protein